MAQRASEARGDVGQDAPPSSIPRRERVRYHTVDGPQREARIPERKDAELLRLAHAMGVEPLHLSDEGHGGLQGTQSVQGQEAVGQPQHGRRIDRWRRALHRCDAFDNLAGVRGSSQCQSQSQS